jgi:hypothetical protein
MSFARSRHVTLVGLLIVGLVATPAAPSFATEIAPPETVVATMDDLAEAPASAASETDATASAPLLADVPFSMIGFSLPDEADEVRVRTRDLDGAWSPWETLGLEVVGVDGPDVNSEEARTAAANVTEPLWVGAADAFEVEVNGQLADVEATLIDTEGLSEGAITKAVRYLKPRTVVPAAEAQAASPNIISRQAWGANESLRRGTPSVVTPRFMVLHHTAGNNTYTKAQSAAVVRGIYSYHTGTQGWADIGYNFLVDKYGQIFEGRHGGIERGIVGAHAAGFNSGSFGVAVMGNYDVVDAPAVAVEAVAQVAAWKYGVHGIDAGTTRTVSVNGRTLRTMIGHRDVGSTVCPGRFLYARMGQLRTRIAAIAATPAPAPAPAPAPTPDGATPVTGDWNGDGRTQLGWFNAGRWHLPTGAGGRTESFVYGRADDVPVVGDWNGNGRDGIGVRRVGRWLLRQTPTPGPEELNFINGFGSDIPVVGDWNANGRDGVGVYRDGQWRLRQTASGGDPQLNFTYGQAGDVPLVGDWNANGRDGIGFARSDQWYLRTTATAGWSSSHFSFGRPDDVRVTGDFNNDGRDTVGVVRGDQWLISTKMPAEPADFVLRYGVEAGPEPKSITSPSVAPIQFPDVPRNSYFADPVSWMVGHKITTGVGKTGEFQPHEAVTRAQMAAFLWRMMDEPTGYRAHGFPDVPANSYYEPAVRWLKATGITDGVGNTGRFEPNRVLTRGEMAEFLYRTAGRPTGDARHRFPDVPRSRYYDQAVSWMVAHGITDGVGNTGRFEPGQPVTRAQNAAFMYRFASEKPAWRAAKSVPSTVRF